MIIPALALRGLCVLPKMVVHFDVSRKKSKAALEKAMILEQKIFLAAQKKNETEEPQADDIYRYGTIGLIKQIVKMPQGVVRVVVEGQDRARWIELDTDKEYFEADVEICRGEADAEIDEVSREAMKRILQEELKDYGKENPAINQDIIAMLLEISELEELMTAIPINIPLSLEDKQQYLETDTFAGRYTLLSRVMANEVEISRIKLEFQQKVKERIDKNQKEYILREQMKLIREELGEEDSLADADTYEQQVDRLKADKEVKDKIRREINRMRSMPPSSQEGALERSYIETMLELPWNKQSKDNKDIAHARQVLNEDHYGLDKIKERVLEYLAVRAYSGREDVPILCLVGPPGTGKTSIARSVARALNKKYVRICLGGVKDEAEIRGHRKTYIGAMPGRIAVSMRQAGVNNPLILLDEIDKLSSSYHGDTAAALLEVLDSEQNKKFRDHYLEVPMDLSHVLFIATANSDSAIPDALYDRMEIIYVDSYTATEKYHIAEKYLIPKQLEKNGLKKEQLTISRSALQNTIRCYTREAGVRGLERKIGEICRKAVREIMENNKKQIKVTGSNLEKYLGRDKIWFDGINQEPEIGLALGLAWTCAGGDVMPVEVNVLPGSGRLQTTGRLGDVMKESAQIAFTYVRCMASQYGADDKFFEETDLHMHFTEGAIPKDGPSAGIVMATALMSVVTMRKIRSRLAMTGEVTIRGRVLPIGGLKEKLLAAKMSGVETVLVPAANRSDVEELSLEITKNLEVIFVNTMEEVLEKALLEKETTSHPEAEELNTGEQKEAESEAAASASPV